MDKSRGFAGEGLASFLSDDDAPRRRRRHEGGFGSLLGDKPKPQLSREAAEAYQVRQASSGPRATSSRGHAAAERAAARPPPRGENEAYRAHLWLLGLLRRPAPKASAPPTDLDVLRQAHRFLRDVEDDDGSWDARLAQRYYSRLFREYVICDLAGYKAGKVGFRWRTEAEVVQGKGQFHCSRRGCHSKLGLRSYEVDFKYVEAGRAKRALVKARVCTDCAYKLHYRRLKDERKRDRKRRKLEGKASEPRAPVEQAPECPKREEAEGPSSDRGGEASEEEGEEDEGGGPAGEEARPSEAERKRLEALAWAGPDPNLRSKEDDMDDYLRALFV